MRRLKLLALLILCIMLCGCWDKIEIEDRLFVLALGIDRLPNGNYVETYSAADSKEVKEAKGPAYKVFSTEVQTSASGFSSLMQRYDKRSFYGHTKVLIFGDTCLKSDKALKEVIDSFMRAHDFHKSMHVFAVEGEAAKIFEVVPKFSPLLGTYIDGIAENSNNAPVICDISLEELTKRLIGNNGDSIIPKIEPLKDEVKVGGAGLIKDYKLITFLNELQTRAINWLSGDVDGGAIDIEMQGTKVGFRYYEFKREISFDKIEGDTVYLNYNFETEGSIEEYILGETFLDSDKLREAEGKIENVIEKECKDIIKLLQDEYQCDVIDVGDYLSKYYPKLYKEVEGDFDKFFSDNVVINVVAKVNLRRVGTMR